MDYQIRPVAVEGFADANGVRENCEGAWLGEIEDDMVHVYCDEDMDFIPAPKNWRELVIKELPLR